MEEKDKTPASDETQDLPFPDTEFSAGAQRAMKRKIESGEDEGVDREEFFRLIGRVGEPQESDQSE